MATPSDSWPNRNLAATVVDTSPPQEKAWPSWAPPEHGDGGAWPTKKRPQRHSRRLVNRTDRIAKPAPMPRPMERWIVAGALWAFAGGLLVGPAVAWYADRGTEVGMGWLARHAPGFLQSYLPKPVPKPIEPPASGRGRIAAPPFTKTPAPKDLPSNMAPKTGHGRRHR